MASYDVSETEESNHEAGLSVLARRDLNSSSVHIVTFASETKGGGNGSTRECCPFLRRSWKTSLSGREKTLCIVIGILAMFAVILLSVLIRAAGTGTTAGLCMTPECVKAAAKVMTSMDPSVDPCENFYQYACGKWADNNARPYRAAAWCASTRLTYDNEKIIKKILEQRAESLASEAERSAQRYYQSCIDANETRTLLGPTLMLELLGKIGGWPAIDPSVDSNFWNFEEAIVTAHVLNVGGFFSWSVDIDDKNSSRHVIQIDQDGLSLNNPDSYLNDTTPLEHLLDKMVSAGQNLNLSADANTTKLEMQDVIDLEKRIAGITVPESERHDLQKLYRTLHIADLNKLAPFMNWISYFNYAFSQVNITIAPSDVVVVYSLDYLKNLSTILKDYLPTKEGKRVLHNYIAWNMAKKYHLGESSSDENENRPSIFPKGSDGEETSCISETNNVMGFAIGAMFVRQNFHEELKPLVESMISSVKQSFKDNLDNLDWMDDETRRAVRKKTDAITSLIGYPKFILDPKELDDYYKDFKVEPDKYFLNKIRANQFSFRQKLLKLHTPVNKSLWEYNPSEVNAFYTLNKNQIVFPAGHLQPPFLDANYPSAYNFGAIGAIIGHELTHAFDDQGIQFNHNSEAFQWWNSDTINRFQNKTECFVDQYSSFSDGDESLDGKRTLGENIADNGGLKAAFRAYTKWAKHRKNEFLYLPGLNMTQNQLFFVSFAQSWCSSHTKEYIHQLILSNEHSPEPFRVIGSLSNMPEFSSIFQCPVGSPMDPEKKCELW